MPTGNDTSAEGETGPFSTFAGIDAVTAGAATLNVDTGALARMVVAIGDAAILVPETIALAIDEDVGAEVKILFVGKVKLAEEGAVIATANGAQVTILGDVINGRTPGICAHVL